MLRWVLQGMVVVCILGAIAALFGVALTHERDPSAAVFYGAAAAGCITIAVLWAWMLRALDILEQIAVSLGAAARPR